MPKRSPNEKESARGSSRRHYSRGEEETEAAESAARRRGAEAALLDAMASADVVALERDREKDRCAALKKALDKLVLTFLQLTKFELPSGA